MIVYTSLNELLTSDFTQLRAVNGRATNDAIHFVFTRLIAFFNQFTQRPTATEINGYYQLMAQIIEKISQAEIEYQQAKPENQLQDIDPSVYRISLSGLSLHLKNCASTGVMGDPIRFPEMYTQAKHFLTTWPTLGFPNPNRRGRTLFDDVPDLVPHDENVDPNQQVFFDH